MTKRIGLNISTADLQEGQATRLWLSIWPGNPASVKGVRVPGELTPEARWFASKLRLGQWQQRIEEGADPADVGSILSAAFPGILVYLMVYPIIRSIIELFRGDVVRGFVIPGVQSTSQFTSVLVFTAA